MILMTIPVPVLFILLCDMPQQTEFDIILVGQGLAGTALGWTLQDRGYRILLIDRCETTTSSKIAAGLITPITGLRLVVSWRLEEFLPFSTGFYRKIEQKTASSFFELKPMLRLFSSEQEQEQYRKRSETHFPELVSLPEPLADESAFEMSRGGFEMTQGGQLDVPTYLSVSRTHFSTQNCFLEADLDPVSDVKFEPERVILPRWNLSADKIIFCEGIHGQQNPWFQSIPFEGAKGEILTLKIPGLTERRVVHRGVWLAHWQDDLYRAGSTYDREHLDCDPTTAGREEICARLSEFLKLPFEVVDHRAAVRPVIRGRLPIMGLHPAQNKVGFFNGFASKGSLQTPWMANYFVEVLEGKQTLDKHLDLSRKVNLSQ
ncbi:bifunctional tRNA (mnm(5)s(2)U34)-methyltransferase/FAD-dependent cmnm(5)s(2)U34 oxidoreductase [Gimesia fumaroli]|uniref:Bifunctional tRNA (Mnm(5)s(2)U34)-methyltransferase/FAD-dependent cmnm(5)s(2)U34 oxidoreductase n=2 Tax=Gimesia fumaroli TaxID=2527976 RepID=A0A518IG34_9PLAN|nr:bifunctional tRNA (mnm(5)s(2)U34)-methyltransferase/FAD-dependent cmnm(5)s(2)U34 oxidoreductase [Gimesia fumaroli]